MIIHAAFPRLRPLGFDSRPSATRLLIGRMARDIRRLGALDSEAAAVRALSACPYRLLDVAALAGEALSEAQFEMRQRAVARTMKASR